MNLEEEASHYKRNKDSENDKLKAKLSEAEAMVKSSQRKLTEADSIAKSSQNELS